VHILVNWLVQGGVVVLAAALALRLIPSSRTRARYAALWAAHVAILVLPVVPYVVPASTVIAPGERMSLASEAIASLPPAWWTSPALAVALWIAWVVLSAARLAIDAIVLVNARRRCHACASGVQTRLRCWSHVRATGRRARLVLSADVGRAAVLAGRSPLIAVAPALVKRLTPDDLDRIVIHEWAHVQRRDDVAQLIERLLLVLVGWHPAARWIEMRLAHEREVACDEMAIAITGSAKQYASSLTTLAALPMTGRGVLSALAAVSATGLRHRLVRILAARPVDVGAPVRSLAIVAGSALFAVAVTVGHIQVVSSSTALLNEYIATARIPQSTTSQDVATARGIEGTPSDSRPPRTSRSKSLTAARGPQPQSVAPRVQNEPPVPPPLPSRPASISMVPLRPTHAGVVDLETAVPEGSSDVAAQNTDAAASRGEKPLREDGQAVTPWGVAASTGVAIGRATQTAGVKTAGFFSRFGKAIAGSY
jgi:beta-lactamase regulating signal transducer with metallopeptidase domain